MSDKLFELCNDLLTPYGRIMVAVHEKFGPLQHGLIINLWLGLSKLGTVFDTNSNPNR